jgi:hypothetical protein
MACHELIGNIAGRSTVLDCEIEGHLIDAAASSLSAGIAWADGDTAIMLSLPHTAEAAEDVIDAVTTGAASFAVSTSKLRELVSEIAGNTVTLQASTHYGPIVATDRGDTGYYSLVMPMRV